jgi:regulator of protease activity HflC (stomatin/prohibitin superfamily)
MWQFIVWILPAFISTLVGISVGVWGAGVGLAFVWLGFCVFQGSIIVKQQEFVVIERLGRFLTVYFHGWHVRVIGVDRVRASGELRAKRIQLYADEKGSKMDFSDASAPIDASMWYQIGDPADIATGTWDKVAEAIRAWVYTYEKPEERIYNLVDGELRPLFQRKKIDQANQDRNGIADEVMDAIVPEMVKFGAYAPSSKKRLIIEDIDLPPEIIEMRSLVLKGQKRAEESENEAAGYWKAIKAIQGQLHVTVEEARSIYETQRGLSTLERTKPTLTLVGKDLANVLGTINLGKQ